MSKDPIAYLKSIDFKLAKVIDTIGILNVNSIEYDSFFFLVREIVGQMISAKVKQVIFDRLLQLCNNNICPENINKLSVEELRNIGLSYSKSEYIINLSELVLSNSIDFERLALLSDDEVLKALTSIKGIGKWTSKMYLLFFLKREDILPYDDMAFLQSYKWLYNTKNVKKESILKRCKKWKPYSSIAARYLYRALDTGLTKIPIKDFLNN